MKNLFIWNKNKNCATVAQNLFIFFLTDIPIMWDPQSSEHKDSGKFNFKILF